MMKRRAHYFWMNALHRINLSAVLLPILVVLPVIAFCSQSLAADTEILSPRSGARVIARNPETHLILRHKGKKEDIRIQVGRSRQYIKPVVVEEGEEHYYMHYRIPLKAGQNSFQVVPGGLKIEINFEQINSDLGLKKILKKGSERFHKDDSLPEACVDCHELKEERILGPVGLRTQPACFSCHRSLVEKEKFKHSTTINRQCLTCHQQSTDPWRIGFPSENIQNLCLGCHTTKKVWFSSAFGHGPLSVGGCTLCHNPHSGKYRYELWAEGSKDLCIACHSEKSKLLDKKADGAVPYVHDIVLGKGCVPCHNPHATNQKFMLERPTNELCSWCHYGIVHNSMGHPVAGHPVSAPRERLRPNRQLTCTSCHDPHGSNHQNMLIETARQGELCRKCHER